MSKLLVDESVEVMNGSGELERQYSLWNLKEAIADYLVDYVRWLDIRLLWRSRRKAFFRVNFWTNGIRAFDSHISRSLFLAVEDSDDGLVVREPGIQ
ncbi:MAG: hypothetical protein HY287_18085 [Planctomycetes bacterium]|nr:hypothetical protein [Planctomycetota bacterium]